jgi:hypothetical protein
LHEVTEKIFCYELSCAYAFSTLMIF